MKNGLVLEGGALRGLYTVGILDVMMENGIVFDGMVGVSAGAAFGCNYKSRQPGRCIRYNKRFAGDWRYCGFKSLRKTGNLYGAEFCYHEIPDHLDLFDTEAFDSNPMEFYAVCTDMMTGGPVYKLLMHHSYECYEWIRASASMPLVSKIVEVGGGKYLDGGVSDSIPLKFFQDKGYERNIVILTQPDGYVKSKNKFIPVMKARLKDYPRFLEAMDRRHIMYNKQVEYVKEQEKSGSTLVFRPQQKLSVGYITRDPNVMETVYRMGRREAEERIGEIRDFLYG